MENKPRIGWYYYKHIDGSVHAKHPASVECGSGTTEENIKAYFDSDFVSYYWKVLGYGR
jgi:hypothetical protein